MWDIGRSLFIFEFYTNSQSSNNIYTTNVLHLSIFLIKKSCAITSTMTLQVLFLAWLDHKNFVQWTQKIYNFRTFYEKSIIHWHKLKARSMPPWLFNFMPVPIDKYNDLMNYGISSDIINLKDVKINNKMLSLHFVRRF